MRLLLLGTAAILLPVAIWAYSDGSSIYPSVSNGGTSGPYNATGDGVEILPESGGASSCHIRTDGALFNGQFDDVCQWGWNPDDVDVSGGIQAAVQIERLYQSAADPDSRVSEFIVAWEGPNQNPRRPYQANCYHQGALADTCTTTLKGELIVQNDSGSTSMMHFRDGGTVDITGDGTTSYLRSPSSGTKWIKQRNAANSADRSLIYLNSGDLIGLGDESTALGVAIPGSLFIGSMTATGSALNVSKTMTPSSAVPGILFSPTINPTNSSNVYGFEVNPTITTPSSVTTSAVYGVRIDQPTITVGGSSTVTTSAALYVAGSSSTGSAPYALYVDSGGGGGQSFVNGNLTIAAASNYTFNGRGTISSSADGTFVMKDNAGTSFSRLALGGTTSSFPALKRSTSGFRARLADDSADTSIEASDYYAYDTSHGFIATGLSLTSGTMGSQGTDGAIRCGWSKRTWTNANVTALGATTAGDISVGGLVAQEYVQNVVVVITGAGAGVTTLTVSVGRTGASYIDYIVASDAKAAANTVYGNDTAERGTNLTGYDLPSWTGSTTINAHFISSGGNLSAVTGSTGSVYVEKCKLP